MATFGGSKKHRVEDSAGNTLTKQTITFYPTQADAEAESNALGSTHINASGDWSFTADVNEVWAKIPDYGIWRESDLSQATLNATFVRGINVTRYGAKGDGVTDDTLAFEEACVDAAGATIHVPPGTYVLSHMNVTGEAHFLLDPDATLFHKGGSGAVEMIAFTGTHLSITGGRIDGNRANQTATYPRPVCINGQLPKGKRLTLRNVDFTGTVKAAIYLANFGGELDIQNCSFSDMAQHLGAAQIDSPTMVLFIADGDEFGKGRIKFHHNRVIGTDTPDFPGSNPGGLFIASSENNGDTGNGSTLEAFGNYFWGIGLNCQLNDVSPFHFYPEWHGARIVGNYFENLSYSAVTAKSVVDFVYTDNVHIGGQIATTNYSDEGVIGYHPGYHADGVRPRAVIANNIVESPGGESLANRQFCIAVHGGNGVEGNHFGADIIIANNVLTGGGRGIELVNINDITIQGNIIKPNGDGTNLTESGITFDNCVGTALIANNQIHTTNGHGIRAITGVNTARFIVQGNRIKTTDASTYGSTFRGAAYVRLSGNEWDSAGPAIDVDGDAAANNVGLLVYDRSNTILSGTVQFDWGQINATRGDLPVTAVPPQVILGAASGLAASGATYAIAGSQTAGLLTVTTGTAPTTGFLATVRTRKPRHAVPTAVVLTPANAAAAASGAYVDTATLDVDDFVLGVGTAPPASTAMKWYYRVVEAV